jgi:hypothetical protein
MGRPSSHVQFWKQTTNTGTRTRTKEENAGHNVRSDPNVTQYAKQGKAGQDKTGRNAIKQNKTG